MDMDATLLLEIESRLKFMQNNKFPATRGPEGYYSQIRALAAAAEADRKLRRKQQIEEIRSRGLSAESDLPLLPSGPPRTPRRIASSQSFTTSQNEDDVEYITQKSSSTTTTRKQRAQNNLSKDDIFEMELEDQPPSLSPLLLSTPVKNKSRAWRKFSLTSPELHPTVLEQVSPGTSPGWSLSASHDKYVDHLLP